MREHPLLASPLHAFPHKHNDADVDFALRPYGSGEWPSELPTGGRARWATFTEQDGEVVVSYPGVRWTQLRADHGWASLQYSVLMRRAVTVPDKGTTLTALKVDSFQAVEYAFVHKKEPQLPVTWYNGDVYAFGESPSGRQKGIPYSSFAREVLLPPGEYILLVRTVYECRMFGDPGDRPPEIKVRVGVVQKGPVEPVVSVVGDVVDGWVMGSWASVQLSFNDTVVVSCEPQESNGIRLETVEPVSIRAGQVRPIPLRVQQQQPLGYDVEGLAVKLTVTTGGRSKSLVASLPLKHVNSTAGKPFHLTFASPEGSPPAFVSGCTVLPPPGKAETSPPVLLALHGAGVDYRDAGWVEAMPRINGMWAVLPSGRTEWGEDWHGGSLNDVWAARYALNPALQRAGIAVSPETVLIGHSNGGQGAWHAAARYPDRIRGIVAVAGYLKIQDYVPYTETTSAHYADPSLLGVLHASLAPYNNDLYASNLASVPVLAVHGADDDNVPPRHGRSHAGIVAAWAGEANVKFVEVPDVGHVWDGVLRERVIIDFLTNLPPKATVEEVRRAGFTLATANPDETGSKAGIRITELAVPGRLARLDVNAPQWKADPDGPLDLHGSNIRRIEITGAGAKSLTYTNNEWQPSPPRSTRTYGPLIRLLASAGPVSIVVNKASELQLSLALRYAHDLRVYHRLDAVILDDNTALHAVADSTLSPGSLVVLGRPEENRFAEWLIAQQRIPVSFPTPSVFKLAGRLIFEKGTGVITLHPHPTSPGLAVLVAGNDAQGFELAARLLPLRTGVPVPDWAVVSPRCRWQAAGGLVGAGFWDADWAWSEGMSWVDRE